jgi:hypothetical protein
MAPLPPQRGGMLVYNTVTFQKYRVLNITLVEISKGA